MNGVTRANSSSRYLNADFSATIVYAFSVPRCCSIIDELENRRLWGESKHYTDYYADSRALVSLVRISCFRFSLGASKSTITKEEILMHETRHWFHIMLTFSSVLVILGQFLVLFVQMWLCSALLLSFSLLLVTFGWGGICLILASLRWIWSLEVVLVTFARIW